MSEAFEKVKLARHPHRPTSKILIEKIFNNFLELHGDRLIGDDKSIIGGLAYFNSMPVTLIAHEKGVKTDEKIYHNFGMPHPEGYHKALRLMKQAEKFNRPIITIIDTPGAYPGIEAEERGQANAIAVLIKEMMNLTVPIISIVLGEGGSGGALAIGISNKLVMFENSIYSVISPEGFASILYKDSSKASLAAQKMKLTARDLLSFKIIDKIIAEKKPLHEDYKDSFNELKSYLNNTLNELMKLTKKELIMNRYKKYRNIGIYIEENKEIDKVE